MCVCVCVCVCVSIYIFVIYLCMCVSVNLFSFFFFLRYITVTDLRRAAGMLGFKAKKKVFVDMIGKYMNIHSL